MRKPRKRIWSAVSGGAASIKPLLYLYNVPGYIDDGLSWAGILRKVGAAMTVLDWVLLAIVVPSFLYAFTPKRLRFWELWELSLVPRVISDPALKSTKPQWCEVPGAIQQQFTLYEAACLLVGDEPSWPLTTQKARDEYKHLLEAVLNDELGDELAFDAGYLGGDHFDGNPPNTVHELGIPRLVLRRYIRSTDRPIADFLDERFDT